MSCAAAPLPVALRLQDRPVLVVGAGKVAARKVETLLAAGALVDVVAPWACREVEALATAGAIAWQARPFAASDVAGHFLVVACTDQDGVDAQVFAACERACIFCTAADRPAACSAWWMAVRRRGEVQVAVSTGGSAPGLAGRIADEAVAKLSPALGRAVMRYAEIRQYLIDHPERFGDFVARGAALATLRRLPWRTLAAAKTNRLAQIAPDKPVE
ncbi:MAG: bifunctional precorrin-2 dehydrogenase/sirohydrochlorin ferrochelatase [Deltaproteobacteria bacterium]|nr:bifunctional precorrin-2 dehydrogenase/sirohydrochlorin ferrochelatase [Deltaproteobacteria bacterium]